jgi:hypothetical protein
MDLCLLALYNSNNLKYVVVGSLVKFVPPAGYYFDANNRLKAGTPTLPDEKLIIWASPTQFILTEPIKVWAICPAVLGPVVLNNYVPTGAIASEVIPLFVTDLPVSFETSMAEQIRLNRNFGIGYDSLGTVTGTAGSWYLITSTNLAIDAEFSLDLCRQHHRSQSRRLMDGAVCYQRQQLHCQLASSGLLFWQRVAE